MFTIREAISATLSCVHSGSLGVKKVNTKFCEEVQLVLSSVATRIASFTNAHHHSSPVKILEQHLGSIAHAARLAHDVYPDLAKISIQKELDSRSNSTNTSIASSGADSALLDAQEVDDEDINYSKVQLDAGFNLGQNESLVLITDLLDPCEENMHLHRCAVIANYEKKSITFVIAGTRFDNIKTAASDIIDDFMLFCGKHPNKLKSAMALNETVLQNLLKDCDNISEYSFHYVGHSLGGLIADLSAAHMAHLLHQLGATSSISTKTFENPGSKLLVSRMLHNQLSPLTVQDVESRVQFLTINNHGSIFAFMDPMGAVYHLDKDGDTLLHRLESQVAKICRLNPITIAKDMSRHRITKMVNAIGSVLNIEV